MDAVRALAVIWRAASDPEGAALNAPEDVAVADLIQAGWGFGYVEKRPAKPHQRDLLNEEPQWVTYFVLNESGQRRWRRILDVVVEPAEHSAGFERYEHGKVRGAL